MARLVPVFAWVLILACAANELPPDGSVRPSPDAAMDAGVPDAETPDTGLPDATAMDAAPPDAGTMDAQAPDAEPVDAGTEALVAPELFEFLAGQQQASTGLLESFVPHPGLPAAFLGYLEQQRPMFVYDASLAIIAWLGRGGMDDRARATRAMDALIAAQRPDGSVPDLLNGATGAPSAVISTGNSAWVMLAWLTGWEQLGEERWRLAAERLGAFLLDPVNRLVNPEGFGGFLLTPGSTVASTEHNLDLYPAFTRLAAALPTSAGLLSADQATQAALRARIFAEVVFDPVEGASFAGTLADGRQINRSPVPLDTQSWSVLSLGRDKWRTGYEWARQAPPDGLWLRSTRCGPDPVQGPPFSSADVGDVWTEGLAQMQAAAGVLGRAQDVVEMADTIATIQRAAPNADGRGLVATCSEIDTGFGFSYFNRLAVGATAWAGIAAVEINPYWGTSTQGGPSAHPAAMLPWVRLRPPENRRFTCSSYRPCLFEVAGDSEGVRGSTYTIAVWVRPLDAGNLPFFRQRATLTVDASGAWRVQAQLGSAEAGGIAGDRLEVVATVVESSAPLPDSVSTPNPDTVPGLVSISGLLDASVE